MFPAIKARLKFSYTTLNNTSAKQYIWSRGPKSEVWSAFPVNPGVKLSQIESNSVVSSIRSKKPWTEIKKLV